MKKLASIIIVAAASALGGQEYIVETPNLATNNIIAGGSEALNVVMPTNGEDYIPVSIAFELDAAGTGNQTLTFERGVDSSSFETLAARKTVVVVAATGTTESVTITNIPTRNCGFVRLTTWANADAANTTNLVVKYGNIRKD